LQTGIECFCLASCGVTDSTQIHTHMCYSEFSDIISSIAKMDADVLSIETSRSHMDTLRAFENYHYPNQIGPGVYDIHSPRVPNKEEIEYLLDRALKYLSPGQIWVNPDCGLKTRDWPETKQALANMVTVAKKFRSQKYVLNP